jgi:hypothetical protein
LQHQQLATSIAAEAMELVRAIPAQSDSAGCSPLLSGRTQTAVAAQWAAAPSGVDLSTTDPAWADAICPTTVTVPLAGLTTSVADDGTTPAITRGGTGYTVRTYIGTCRLPLTGGACARAASVRGGTVTMMRVIVAVGWQGSNCPASSCLYTLGTLVDRSADPLFNLRSTTVPVAVNDVVCTASGVPILVSLLGNDVGPLGSAPVTVVGAPAHGTLAASVVTGTAIFTPVQGYVGLDAFTYRLTSSSGTQSGLATVTVKIGVTC